MVLYDGAGFTVTNGWFRGLRVIDKSRGTTIKPPHDLSHKVLTLWVTLGSALAGQPAALRRARHKLIFDFGMACVYDGDPGADMLLATPAPSLLALYAEIGLQEQAGWMRDHPQ
jgi:hypothetical protein